MAPKRRLQQRVKEVGAAVEESIRQDGEDQKIQHVSAEQLFHVDSKGGDDIKLTKKQKLQQKDPLVKSRKFQTDKANKYEMEKLKKLKSLQEVQSQPSSTKKPAAQSNQLWGSDGNAAEPAEVKQLDEYVMPAVVKKVKRRKLVAPTKHKVQKVAVAAPGQSYHPDFETHQDIMAEAVAQELERQEIQKELAKPLSKGLSEETLQYIDTRESDEESDESEAEDEDTMTKPKKVPTKLTRAQRNKRSRHKQMELEHQIRRNEKTQAKQINTAKHILQEIVRDEKASQQKQEIKKLREEQKLQEEPLARVGSKKVKLMRETPVSFSDELNGNMRSLKPKGNPLLDRFDSLHTRNMIQLNRGKQPRKRNVRIIEAKKAMAPVMRPSNFRHDMRRGSVVEIRREEYERSKHEILKKIRRRLLILGVIIGILSLVAIALGSIIRAYHNHIVKFQTKSGGVQFQDLYFIYGGVSLLFSFHGFHMDGKWKKLQADGNRLVMHVRVYSFLGLSTLALAIWLGSATLSVFGLVEIRYIADSSPNLIYLVTLVMVCIHLVIPPWLLRTIHRKGSQADQYYAAEFIDEVKKSRKRGDDNEEKGDDEEDGDSDTEGFNARAIVVPAVTTPHRSTAQPGSGKVFFNADGMSTVAPHRSASIIGSPRSRQQLDGGDVEAAMVTVSTMEASPSPYIVGHEEVPVQLLRVATVDQIPFASPIFVMDRDRRLLDSEYWRLWKHVETTGSFSFLFKNKPSQQAVEAHLHGYGFQLITSDYQPNATLQVHFYGYQYGTDNFFLCEFVLIFTRRFFQATFKCKDESVAADFVTRFNLQELLVVDENY